LNGSGTGFQALQRKHLHHHYDRIDRSRSTTAIPDRREAFARSSWVESVHVRRSSCCSGEGSRGVPDGDGPRACCDSSRFRFAMTVLLAIVSLLHRAFARGASRVDRDASLLRRVPYTFDMESSRLWRGLRSRPERTRDTRTGHVFEPRVEPGRGSTARAELPYHNDITYVPESPGTGCLKSIAASVRSADARAAGAPSSRISIDPARAHSRYASRRSRREAGGASASSALSPFHF